MAPCVLVRTRLGYRKALLSDSQTTVDKRVKELTTRVRPYTPGLESNLKEHLLTPNRLYPDDRPPVLHFETL